MIYFDNAATSWPKPPAVCRAISTHLTSPAGNPGRSGHRVSVAAARQVAHTREVLCQLLQVPDPSRIIFTLNATHALNVALHGLLRPGDRVITTSVEHNSVMRPLRHLESLGVVVTTVPCDPHGLPEIHDVQRAILPGTRLLVTTHASNVTGAVLPVGEMAGLARERGIVVLVDASQSVGSVPIDLRTLGADAVAFSGHKGLLGPTGTGVLWLRDGLDVAPLVRGGTGSDSAREQQPGFLPDALESGTPNLMGIVGLGAGVRFLQDIGIETVMEHERALVARFIDGVSRIPGIVVYGPQAVSRRCGVVSFNLTGASPSEVELILDRSFGIMARSGLHCAPSAHRTLGTFPTGTVRFSFGWFNRPSEVDAAIEAVRQIGEWATKAPPLERRFGEAAIGRQWTG